MESIDDFGLIPDEGLTAEADLEAAAASALAEPDDAVVEPPRVPFGRTWKMDWKTGRFLRHGSSPMEVRGTQALEQWLMMAAHAAWGAHAVFDGEFGTERPDSPLGMVGEEALVEAGDWAARLVEAWTVHDRVVGVEELAVRFIDDETIFLGSPAGGPFIVITDEDEEVPVGPLTFAPQEG